MAAPTYVKLVTEFFDSEDPYLEADAVFGVRGPLVGTFKTTQDPELCRRHGIEGDTCLVMDIELRLSKNENE